MILEMRNNKDYGSLQTLFYGKTTLYDRLRESLKYQDPLEVFDPRGDLGRVSLSPIGVVHLFASASSSSTRSWERRWNTSG